MASDSVTYCTFFDSRYLARGLALIQSLERHAPNPSLTVMALDEDTALTLEANAPWVRVFLLESLEKQFPSLAEAKRDRSRVEYLFTLTPHLPLHLRNSGSPDERIVYVDADLWFFSDPAHLNLSVASSNVAIVPHRFPRRLRYKNRYGRFNVGWLSFAPTQEATACLEWWADRCIEWCHTSLEGNRYADQKYLDQWPRLFDGVEEVDHPGANLAPWNLDTHSIKAPSGSPTVDGEPLVFFHFHALSRVVAGVYNCHFEQYLTIANPTVRRLIYRPYLQELERHYAELADGPLDRSIKDLLSIQMVRAG